MYTTKTANSSEKTSQKILTEDQLIDLANEEFAETDNMEDAIENDLLFYDCAYDAELSLNEFGFKVVEL